MAKTKSTNPLHNVRVVTPERGPLPDEGKPPAGLTTREFTTDQKDEFTQEAGRAIYHESVIELFDVLDTVLAKAEAPFNARTAIRDVTEMMVMSTAIVARAYALGLDPVCLEATDEEKEQLRQMEEATAAVEVDRLKEVLAIALENQGIDFDDDSLTSAARQMHGTLGSRTDEFIDAFHAGRVTVLDPKLVGDEESALSLVQKLRAMADVLEPTAETLRELRKSTRKMDA